MGFTLKKLFDDVTENHGLSGATVNKIKLNLSAIFTAAVKKEILRRNPCRLATPPKIAKPAVYMDTRWSGSKAHGIAHSRKQGAASGALCFLSTSSTC